MLSNSWAAAQLAASREGLSSLEFVMCSTWLYTLNHINFSYSVCNFVEQSAFWQADSRPASQITHRYGTRNFNTLFTEQVCLEVILCNCIRDVHGSNLVPDTSSFYRGFSWFSSILAAKCRGSISLRPISLPYIFFSIINHISFLHSALSI
jgi:hypothetical protein